MEISTEVSTEMIIVIRSISILSTTVVISCTSILLNLGNIKMEHDWCNTL